MRQKIKGLGSSNRFDIRWVGFGCGGREQLLHSGSEESFVRKPETSCSDLRWSVYKFDV